MIDKERIQRAEDSLVAYRNRIDNFLVSYLSAKVTNWWGELTLEDYVRLDDGDGFIIELEDNIYWVITSALAKIYYRLYYWRMSRKKHPLGLDIFFLGKMTSELEIILTLKNKRPWSHVKDILESISKFKNYFSIGFIAKDAQGIIESIGKGYPDASKPLSTTDVEYIKGITAEWIGAVFEISEKWVFCVSTASLDSARLMDGIASFLDKEELSILEPKEREGLDESANCLLHNSFTSAEFIALRTTESLLRRWYKNKTDKDLTRQRWGDILNELNDIYPKISERPKELSLLDYLRLRRNEIDHPEAVSTPDEASATFLNTISVCKAVKSVLLTEQPQ